MLKIISAADLRSLERVVATGAGRDRALEQRVATIVADVQKGGDRALLAYARRYDGFAGSLEIDPDEIAEGASTVPAAVRRALRNAARRITDVARAQVPRTTRVRVAPGVTIEQRVVPLQRVACCVPGGRYPLPSSLLMTAIPARVAGVPEIVAACPRPDPTVFAAAIEAGVTRLFRMGGAHAIAALAYGTASVPRVDKIVGPGSAYVAAAKALVARDCAIDFYAGPSEIVIVSSAGDPAWVAADLVAQAEHDVDARAILLTSSKRFAQAVRKAVAAQLPAEGPARLALERNGAIVVTRSLRESIEIADRLAPEHLVCDDERVVDGVRAGAVFVGRWAAQASGDYATGSNHVLPTCGAARGRGGLSAADFVRVTAVQRLTQRGLRGIAPTAIALAEAEGLTAHAHSIKVRLA